MEDQQRDCKRNSAHLSAEPWDRQFIIPSPGARQLRVWCRTTERTELQAGEPACARYFVRDSSRAGDSDFSTSRRGAAISAIIGSYLDIPLAVAAGEGDNTMFRRSVSRRYPRDP